MGRSAPRSERDRTARRSGVVFGLSVSAAGLALFVGFGVVMAGCVHSVSDLVQFPALTSSEPVRPIPIPQTACPYLRLVAAAAEKAGAPWPDGLKPSADWKRFTARLSAPLAALDAALAGAVPHVPDLVAQDLRAVRQSVQVGRVQLFAASSVSDYLTRSQVLSGYSTLQHASGLVANACGFTLAPPFPF